MSNNVVFLLSCFRTGMKTQKIDNLLWFIAVGLSGKDGMEGKWRMKTLPTLLKENNHTKVGLFLSQKSCEDCKKHLASVNVLK